MIFITLYAIFSPLLAILIANYYMRYHAWKNNAILVGTGIVMGGGAIALDAIIRPKIQLNYLFHEIYGFLFFIDWVIPIVVAVAGWILLQYITRNAGVRIELDDVPIYMGMFFFLLAIYRVIAIPLMHQNFYMLFIIPTYRLVMIIFSPKFAKKEIVQRNNMALMLTGIGVILLGTTAGTFNYLQYHIISIVVAFGVPIAGIIGMWSVSHAR